MANRLTMAKINAILTLHESEHSNREIARLLGVHRETVGKYVAGNEAQNRPNAPTGSEAVGAGGGPPPVATGPPSDCEPFRQLILEKIEQGLAAVRIHQDLCEEPGFAASYHSVRRFVGRLRKKSQLPFRRLETLPGEEAQVAFGTGAPIHTPQRKRRRPWIFRIVLSHSRKAYSEALLPLPSDRFPFFHEARRAVHRDGHVEVDKAYYSLPPEYVGRRLWVRWDGRLVRVFNDRWQQVAVHAKAEPGRFRTAAEHIPKEKVSAVERGTDALLRQVATIGPQTRQWAEAMTQARGVEGVRVLVGLKALAGKYDAESLEKASEIALSHGAYRLRSIRQLLKRQASKQKQFDFLEEHPIIRPLSHYSLQSLRIPGTCPAR